ncbi:MAG: universal stress protein [Pseudomonadota bacterium]
MHYRTIVTVVRSEEDGRRVMNAITPFAQANESHVIAVHAETSALAYMPVAGVGAAAYDEAIIEANKERMDELQTWFTGHCEKEGISHEFRGFENFMGDSAVSAITSAFACDLVVTQQTDPSTPGDSADDIESLLFETGRPLLLIPYTCTDAIKFKKVVIAWKDSKEAARAVFDALPILMAASFVEILVIDGEDDAEKSAIMNAAEIAAALDRHKVKVEIRNEQSGSIPVSAAIENRLTDFGADLLIMGAYSRPRIAERIFGGVTSTIMQTMVTPTFLSH